MNRIARLALLALIPMALLPVQLLAGAFSGHELLFSVLEELLLFGLPALLLWPREWKPVQKPAPPLLALPAGLLLGGLLQVLLMFVTAIASQVLPWNGPARPISPETPAEWAAAIAAWVLVPAITEELFFRGVLCRALAGTVGAWRAVLVSAGAFALLHGQPAATPALFLLALVLGTCLVTTDSLPMCIGIHTGYNLIALLWRHPAFFDALPVLVISIPLWVLLWRTWRRRPARPAEPEDPLLPLLIPAGLLAASLSFFI